jgi:hypothetical protein
VPMICSTNVRLSRALLAALWRTLGISRSTISGSPRTPSCWRKTYRSAAPKGERRSGFARHAFVSRTTHSRLDASSDNPFSWIPLAKAAPARKFTEPRRGCRTAMRKTPVPSRRSNRGSGRFRLHGLDSLAIIRDRVMCC